ncbi:hypothetical protein [Actinacidiphila acididurans]|uniref:ABC transporter permease n=1 Tax=Actinacidiphila acididurans TaxID=2784346 RepID=A0ABS2TSR4_9ACTN|nr:hypothetical protein [Actinacidiphila acididurans]MBM9505541.1 hypothetical protein [Actinacidiphila acididurans]
MTAPLTPHEQPPHFPPYPGGGDVSGTPADNGSPVRGELLRGVLVALLVAICGLILGLFWLWLSPRIPMVSDGQAVYLKDTEGEEAIGGDGTFVLIAVVLGVLTAAAVFLRRRTGGIGVVLGLAVGGVLASLVGWRLGVALGPTTDIVAHAKAVGPKVVFDGPLELRAKSALVAWSAAAMLTHLCLTSAFGPRDPEPETPKWAPPVRPAEHPGEGPDSGSGKGHDTDE